MNVYLMGVVANSVGSIKSVTITTKSGSTYTGRIHNLFRDTVEMIESQNVTTVTFVDVNEIESVKVINMLGRRQIND